MPTAPLINSRQGCSGISSSQPKASFLLSTIWVSLGSGEGSGCAKGRDCQSQAEKATWSFSEHSSEHLLCARIPAGCGPAACVWVHLRAYVFMTRIPRDRGWTYPTRFLKCASTLSWGRLSRKLMQNLLEGALPGTPDERAPLRGKCRRKP